MKLTKISDFKLGRSIQGFYLCREKHIRHTRSGGLFLDMIFSDSTGTIAGKLWDMVDHFQDRFESGDPVAVKGKITEFNDDLQITVTKVNQATDSQYGKYGFSPNLLIRMVEEPVDVLWKRLSVLIDTLANPYKRLTQSVFKAHEKKIRIMPASVCYHHLIRGGFLKHLVATSEMAISILQNYPKLDRNLVLSGILLHDIGKVKSINDDLNSNYTDAGRLIGHVSLGRDMVRDAAITINHFPNEILLKLEHIVLVTQSSVDGGSLIHPRFPEALLVYYIDQLDSRIALMLDTAESDTNKSSTYIHNHFRSELYTKY